MYFIYTGDPKYVFVHTGTYKLTETDTIFWSQSWTELNTNGLFYWG